MKQEKDFRGRLFESVGDKQWKLVGSDNGRFYRKGEKKVKIGETLHPLACVKRNYNFAGIPKRKINTMKKRWVSHLKPIPVYRIDGVQFRMIPLKKVKAKPKAEPVPFLDFINDPKSKKYLLKDVDHWIKWNQEKNESQRLMDVFDSISKSYEPNFINGEETPFRERLYDIISVHKDYEIWDYQVRKVSLSEQDEKELNSNA